MLDKKKLILIIGFFVILLLVLVVFLELKKSKNETKINNESVGNIYLPDEKTTAIVPNDFVETDARKAVPVGVVVPEPSDVMPDNLVNEIAVPTAAVQAASGTDTKIRVFNVSADGGVFTPSKIIANQGDIIHIEFTAVDRDYDLVFAGYGMSATVSQAQTKSLEFQASLDGRFPYYCVSCGGTEINAQGEITVVK